jgi:glycine betaine/proline transport system permease protein
MNQLSMTEHGVPQIPVGELIEIAFDWVDDNLGGMFDLVTAVVSTSVEGMTALLTAPPQLVVAAVLAGLALLLKGWRFGVGSAVAFVLVIGMGQWTAAMETLALVLFATVVAVLISVPLGIAAARSGRVSAAVRPVMDLMQTMPAFVWLVPVVTLFGIGVVPGVIATIIFALPPGVRLTELGIRQVDPEVVEAGHAFGSSPGQILRGIQLPLALPTVMAGVNQVIMLALSMAVIAGLVGAGGLGGVVTSSIARLDIGLGFEGGISVVILAVYLDRVTAAVGRGGGRRLRIRRRTTTPQTAQPAAEPAATR